MGKNRFSRTDRHAQYWEWSLLLGGGRETRDAPSTSSCDQLRYEPWTYSGEE